MKRLCWMIAALALAPAARATAEDYDALLAKIPDHANVVMLVNLDALKDSAIGKQEGWREKAATGEGSLGLGNKVRREAVGARIDLSTMQEHYRIGVAEAPGAVGDLAKIARREGGFVETIRNTPVAWTPRGFHLVTFPPKLIGFAATEDRQVVTAWIEQIRVRDKALRPGFAAWAISRAERGAALSLAIDLQDVVSPKLVIPWLATIEGVGAGKLDPETVASRLAGVRSATLTVEAKQSLEASLRLEFEMPVAPFASAAKEIVMAVLTMQGFNQETIAGWEVEAKDRLITLSGRFSPDALRRALDLARPPAITDIEGSDNPQPAAATTAPNAPPHNSAAQPAQRYFRGVVDLCNSVKRDAGSDPRHNRFWYDKYAKRIDEMPILGVDPELLEWGSTVAQTLRELSMGINYARRDLQYRNAQTSDGYYGGYDAYGNYGVVGEGRAAQATQLKEMQDAKLSVGIDQKWKAIDSSIGEMRRKMVAKYQVDF